MCARVHSASFGARLLLAFERLVYKTESQTLQTEHGSNSGTPSRWQRFLLFPFSNHSQCGSPTLIQASFKGVHASSNNYLQNPGLKHPYSPTWLNLSGKIKHTYRPIPFGFPLVKRSKTQHLAPKPLGGVPISPIHPHIKLSLGPPVERLE